jgi:hypothetical protein
MYMSRASSLRPIEEKRHAIMAISLQLSSVPVRIRVVRILKYSCGVKEPAVVPSYKTNGDVIQGSNALKTHVIG